MLVSPHQLIFSWTRPPLPSTDKLLRRLRNMIRLMDENWSDFIVQRAVSQFYYMEVAEEITILQATVDGGVEALEPALEQRKRQAFQQWRKDYCWLLRYLRMKKNYDHD